MSEVKFCGDYGTRIYHILHAEFRILTQALRSIRQRRRLLLVFSFIETRLFTRLVQEYLDDDEYRELQKVLVENPENGEYISRLRRITQSALACAGTRETWRLSRDLLCSAQAGRNLDAMYPKNVAENIRAHVLRQIRKEVENG